MTKERDLYPERTNTTSRRLATRVALVATIVAVLLPAAASAQPAPFPGNVTLTPESDSATAGTCNEFTARVTGFGDGPGEGPAVEDVTLDVLQVLDSPGNEPAETRELSFCNPADTGAPNPTGADGTAFGDVSGNNPGQTAGAAGRNTTVRAEIGPTDDDGEVTFGISIAPVTSSGTVTVVAWVDLTDDDELVDEPSDASTKTWLASEAPSPTGIDAQPEAAQNVNGTQHQVTVLVSGQGGPMSGVTPLSTIVANATGRPGGDVVDPAAGASPNFVPGKAKPDAYGCSVSNAQGQSTCSFQDLPGTGPGTDTIVFFVDAPGSPEGLDAGDPQDAVQKTWVPAQGPPPSTPPSAPEARNVTLCHGTGIVPCDTVPRSVGVGVQHTVAALVTDRGGRPLANIPVQLRETGPAAFTSSGGNSIVAATGADGVVRAALYSGTFGTSVLVAEISPPGVPGSFRGLGAADDECEQPAGPGGGPGAGNCVSQPLTVHWVDDHEDPEDPECEDGIDNDDDGYVDHPADPGCTDASDGSETPDPAPEVVQQGRRTNMRFRDWVGPTDEGLVIFGRVRLTNLEDRFHACVVRQTVEIQRRIDGGWVTQKTVTTNRTGRWTGVVLDFTDRYRALALESEIVDDDTGTVHVCERATKVKTHHHRR